jgi:hypothetical protein
MQENVCDVGLDERKRLGQKLWETIHGLRTDQPQDMMFTVGWVDYKPNFLYILATVHGIGRPELFEVGVLRAAQQGGLLGSENPAGIAPVN